MTVRVVDSSTGAVTQRDTCFSLYLNEGFYQGGAIPAPAVSTFSSLPGGDYWVAVGSCGMDHQYLGNWHDGTPLTEQKPAGAAIVVAAGQSKTVTITIDGGVVSGTFDDATSGCSVEIYPADDTGLENQLRLLNIRSGEWRAALASGSYQLVSFCGDSARYYGTNQSPYLGGAQNLVIQDRSDITLNFDRATYSQSQLRPITIKNSPLSDNFAFCTDVVTATGQVAYRQRSFAINGQFDIVSEPGERRLRFWACGDQQFSDVWYPNLPTSVGAELLTINAAGNMTLPALVQLVVDPDLVCAGRPATIVGTPGNDVILGTEGNDVIVGLAGADTIRAGSGRDIICGGDGRDRIFGGRQADLIYGGARGDLIKGEAGKDTIYGEGGRDRLVGANGDDFLRGGSGAADRLDGRGGTDYCHDQSTFTRFTNCETIRPER